MNENPPEPVDGSPPDLPPDPVLHTTLGLLRDYRNGDKSAFTRLYERHAPAVRHSIARRLGVALQDLVDIDDVLQETFVVAWRHVDEDRLTSVSTIGGFRNFLVTVAIHRIQDMARATKRLRRQQSRNVPLTEVEDDLVSERDRPSQLARGRELQEIQEAVFLELSDSDRLVLDCRDKLGMSFLELAEQLGCKASNAKVRHFRAKERFRERLAARLDGR